MKTTGTGPWQICKFPHGLRRKLCARAVAEGRSITALAVEAVKMYLNYPPSRDCEEGVDHVVHDARKD
jgi:hypothetical protein